jgi:hypothetical protein
MMRETSWRMEYAQIDSMGFRAHPHSAGAALKIAARQRSVVGL